MLVTGDKGLCGAFNSNVLRAAIEWFRARAGPQDVLRRRRPQGPRHGAPPARPRHRGRLRAGRRLPQDLVRATPNCVGQAVIDAYLTKGVSSVTVLYNEFKSVAQQRLLTAALLPIPAPPVVPETVALPDYGFEPGRGPLLSALLPRYIKAQAYRILLESQAAELAARMNAMDAASKNAKELREALNLDANRTRQALITKEIAELVGGAEALSA